MSISENAMIGSGEFVYECHHNWDRQSLPGGYEYGNASHGIAFDSQGLIYISHNGNPGSIFVCLFRATRNETELVYVIFLFVKNSFVME